MSCPRCGQPLAPNTPNCPRCGAPVAPPAGWSQPAPGNASSAPFAMPAMPYGAPPSPPQGFNAAQQPPRFSAGSLISDGDLPEWLREPLDEQGAPQQVSWGPPSPAPSAQPGPAMGQGWQRQAEPHQPDIASQYTVRQPSVGAADQASPPTFPFGQPQPGYAQQPQPGQFNQSGFQAPAYPPQGYPPQQQAGYAPQQPPMGYPPQQQQAGYVTNLPVGYPPQQQQAGYAPQQPPSYALPQQPAYPPQQGYPQQGYPQQGYPQQGYPQQTGPVNYPGYPQIPQMPPAQVNAFPSIEQAGTDYRGPQAGGMAGHALLDQEALPNWLAGQPGVAPRAPVPSGMQARSLVDDHLLPKWLRDQPDTAGAASVSDWIGASAAHEPMPPFLSEAYAQAPTARAPQPQPEPAYNAAPRPPVAEPQPNVAPPMPPQAPQLPQEFGAMPAYNGGGQQGYAEDAPLPEWLRAQMGGPAPQPTGVQDAPASFAASDLIDPAALPDWVTQRAPAPQQFSSTRGWSAVDPEPEASSGLAATGYASGLTEAEYAAGPTFDGASFDDSTGAQAQGAHMNWDESSWGYGANGDMAYDQRGAQNVYGRGRPLGPEELPSWLRGKDAAQPDGPNAHTGQNPWMAASQPEDYGNRWDDGENWSQRDGGGAQDWDESAGWDAARGAYDDPAPGGWSNQRDSARWEEAERRQRGPAPRGRGEPPQRGYVEQYNDERYDNMGDEMDYDDQDDPSDAQRGRGWLGFLRRDKR